MSAPTSPKLAPGTATTEELERYFGIKGGKRRVLFVRWGLQCNSPISWSEIWSAAMFVPLFISFVAENAIKGAASNRDKSNLTRCPRKQQQAALTKIERRASVPVASCGAKAPRPER